MKTHFFHRIVFCIFHQFPPRWEVFRDHHYFYPFYAPSTCLKFFTSKLLITFYILAVDRYLKSIFGVSTSCLFVYANFKRPFLSFWDLQFRSPRSINCENREVNPIGSAFALLFGRWRFTLRAGGYVIALLRIAFDWAKGGSHVLSRTFLSERSEVSE